MRLIARIEWPLLALWVAFALGLSQITGAVKDWFVMTDELVYERLAISIAKTGSPLPHIHDQFVRSLDQLYPLLIAPFFRHGLVPHDIHEAHLLNAWVMTSACIPAFFLARRVTGRRSAGYLVGVLSVTIPWLVYAPFLLTEVAAYPAFLWALLAFQSAIASPSRRNDVLALLGIALAFLARTQFVSLAGVLPVALISYERLNLRAAIARHRVLAGVYAVAVVAALIFVATGGRLLSLSVYGEQLHGGLLTWSNVGSFAGHAADLSFGLGILPFVVGVGWLLANLVRRAPTSELGAFACLGAITMVVVTLEATSYDRTVGPFVLDRYLFYLVPIVLVAFVCALLDHERPRWSLAAPAAVVAAGFALHLQPTFTWALRIQLDPDSPIATMYHPIAKLAGGRGGAAAVLATGTILLTVLFVIAAKHLKPRVLTAVLLALLAIGLPAETTFMFHRLLDTDGTSQRPLTQSEAGVYNVIDQKLGTSANVTAIPYVVSSDFFVTERYWRDFEFWNVSVQHDGYYPAGDPYSFLGLWFPKTQLAFNPRTGAANVTLSRYVVQSVTDTRFRISGPSPLQTPQIFLIDALQPWRTDWLSFGIYDDGWTRPGVTARIRIFSGRGQQHPEIRTLTLQIHGPNSSQSPYTVVSDTGRQTANATDNATSFARIEVCVPAHGYSDVSVSTPVRASIPGDLSNVQASVSPREGGIEINDIALADEIGGSCRT
ncbi:MAG TPA: hypothetical protein VG652_12510 [Gaiellaceae bacterium]|nr:hypothetical protein [Gaiellaceae bacterium]